VQGKSSDSLCTALAGLSQGSQKKGPARRELSETERIELDELRANPTAAARYRAARLYYDANQLPEAARGFCELVEQERGRELGQNAVKLLWDSLNLLQEYEFLSKSVERHCPWMKDRETAELCRKMRMVFARREAEQLARAGKFREAAALSLRLAEE